jgi:hypothetical protein
MDRGTDGPPTTAADRARSAIPEAHNERDSKLQRSIVG